MTESPVYIASDIDTHLRVLFIYITFALFDTVIWKSEIMETNMKCNWWLLHFTCQLMKIRVIMSCSIIFPIDFPSWWNFIPSRGITALLWHFDRYAEDIITLWSFRHFCIDMLPLFHQKTLCDLVNKNSLFTLEIQHQNPRWCINRFTWSAFRTSQKFECLDKRFDDG